MNTTARIPRWLALFVVFAVAGVVCLRAGHLGAQAATLQSGNPAAPEPSQTPGGQTSSQSSNSAESNAAGQAADQIIEFVNKIPKEPKKEGPSSGPPAKLDMLTDELRIRAQFVKDQLEQSRLAEERAKNAKNSAE